MAGKTHQYSAASIKRFVKENHYFLYIINSYLTTTY